MPKHCLLGEFSSINGNDKSPPLKNLLLLLSIVGAAVKRPNKLSVFYTNSHDKLNIYFRRYSVKYKHWYWMSTAADTKWQFTQTKFHYSIVVTVSCSTYHCFISVHSRNCVFVTNLKNKYFCTNILFVVELE